MKTIIVDDERLARKELLSLLEVHPEVNIVAECSNPEEAIERIDELKPDLVFLDIQMPGKNGFEMLEELDFTPHIIFVTAYDDYAIKAFEVNALDYLLKPVDAQRLAEAIKKVEHQRSEEEEQLFAGAQTKLTANDRVFLKDGEKCWYPALKDVRMFESEGNYIRVHFGKNKPLILKSLNNLEKRLDERDFFRINRKFIVNLHWIAHVETWFNGGLQITLTDGEKLEVSRRQTSRFRDTHSL